MGAQRYASVIGLPSENVVEYERLHARVWPAVEDRLRRSNVQNYSIFRFENLLFSYLEYVGEDYEADMAAIASDPDTQRWWQLTAPLQLSLRRSESEEWWVPIPEVFHLE